MAVKGSLVKELDTLEEFAEEDRQLAEEGIADYTKSLAKEDKQ